MMPDKKRYLVRDLAYETGLHPDTIRRIADRHLIESRRDYNNWRIFDESALKQLKEITGTKDESSVSEQ